MNHQPFRQRAIRWFTERLAAPAAIGLALGLAFPGHADAATMYRITDLRDLGRGTKDIPSASFAQEINDSGQVVGRSSTFVDEHRAFLWQKGSAMQNLGTLPGYSGSGAQGVNNAGQVVGSSSSSSRTHAFLWSADTGMQDLGDLAGGADFSAAYGVNDAGQVVGHSETADGRRAFLWSQGSGMQNLGVLPGGESSYATAINNVGMVTGQSGSHAYVWSAGSGMQNLGGLPGGDGRSFAADINDAGQVVGDASAATGSRAFLWTATHGMQDLGDLPGGADFSYANGVNEAGEVVGGSFSDKEFRAVLWDTKQGLRDLNDLIDPDDPLAGKITLTDAAAINDAGDIVANGWRPSAFRGDEWGERAFLLSPVPEAAATIQFLLGIGVLGGVFWVGAPFRAVRAVRTPVGVNDSSTPLQCQCTPARRSTTPSPMA